MYRCSYTVHMHYIHLHVLCTTMQHTYVGNCRQQFAIVHVHGVSSFAMFSCSLRPWFIWQSDLTIAWPAKLENHQLMMDFPLPYLRLVVCDCCILTFIACGYWEGAAGAQPTMSHGCCLGAWPTSEDCSFHPDEASFLQEKIQAGEDDQKQLTVNSWLISWQMVNRL